MSEVDAEKTSLDILSVFMAGYNTKDVVNILRDPDDVRFIKNNNNLLIKKMSSLIDKGEFNIVRIMIDVFIKLKVKAKTARPLEAAVLAKNFDLIKKSHQWCGNINNNIAIEYAVTTHQKEVLEYLLEHAPDKQKKNKQISHMALAHACAQGNEEFVDMLIDYCDVNDVGGLALQWSIRHDRIEVAKKLIINIDLDAVEASMKKKDAYKKTDYSDFLQTLKAFAVKQKIELALDQEEPNREKEVRNKRKM